MITFTRQNKVAAVICCLSVAVCLLVLYGRPIDKRAAENMGAILQFLRDFSSARSLASRDLEWSPRDFVAVDDHTCQNSWRMLIDFGATRLEPQSLNKCWKSEDYDKFDDDWYKLFCLSTSESTPRLQRFTEIMAIVGPDVPFTELAAGDLIKRIKDLPDDALLLIEVPDSNVHWMEAGDLQLDDLEAAAKRQVTLGTGFSLRGRWVAFADGTVWLLDKETPISALLPFCTVEGAKKHDRDDVLGEYMLYEYDP